MIPFNVPPVTGDELEYIKEAIEKRKICGDGEFTKRCHQFLEQRFGAQKALLTTSGTAALDMAALLCGIKPGDEVIVPSFTFTSTANCAVLAGAKLVFCDIRPDTMNLDEKRLEEAITDKTRAVIVVHYAGVGCEMDEIMTIAERHHLKVVEDAAQGVMARYKGHYLGTIGDFGCYSFHETKNYSMGEGGAVIIKDEKDNLDAEILREKGTNRSQFFRGQVDKYTWMSFGDSFLPSELNAAYLWAQLQRAEEINDCRLKCWNFYHEALADLEKEGRIIRPFVPTHCEHNAHMYYIKVRDLKERSELIAWLKEREITAVFHYIPLHSSPAGQKYGRFAGEDKFTTKESERLLRLPMYYGLTEADQSRVVESIQGFFKR